MIQQTVAALRRWFSREVENPPTVHDMDVDRRLWVRCLTDLSTTCRPTESPEGKQLHCRVRDLSRGGMSLLLRAPIDSGTLMSIDFPGFEEQPPYTVLATVMHVLSLPNGDWSAGCAFACELSEEEVHAFVSKRRPTNAPPDQRGWVRFPCVTRATFHVVDETQTPAEEGRVQDISPSGLGMVLSRKIDVGALLSLELPGVRDEVKVAVLASIARTSTGGKGEWVVGCTFSRELSNQEMQALVRPLGPVNRVRRLLSLGRCTTISGMDTPASLLERLRQPGEEKAWARFVDLYTPLLYHWARQRAGLSAAEAADLVQDVFTLLVQKLPQFVYDGQKSFRGWLRTVLLNKWREGQRRRQVQTVPAGDALPEVAGPDEVAVLDDDEYRRHLARRALQLMQAEFQDATWKACWEVVVEGKAPAQVAGELGLSVNAVYLARSRVLHRLRHELAGLLNS